MYINDTLEDYYSRATPIIERQWKLLQMYPVNLEWGYKTMAEIQDSTRGIRIDALIKPFLSTPGRRCLDLGCFLGHVSFSLAQLGYDVIAVDTRTDVLEVAEIGKRALGLKNLEFIKADSEIMTRDFTSESFDLLVMDDVIEHFNDPHQVLVDSYRVLKKNGCLYISSQNRWFPFEGHSRRWFFPWTIKKLYTWGKLKQELLDVGFEVNNQTLTVLRKLAKIYTSSGHHGKIGFFYYSMASMIVRNMPRFVIEPFLNIVTEIHFVVAVKRF